MKLKYLILLIGVVAISVVIIPSIYSTFGSQHSFTGGDCVKCHSDIKDQLDSSAYHSTLTCETCHVDPNLGGENRTHGNVTIPRCLTCHGNISYSLNADSHKPLIMAGIESPLMKEENEACVICHTTKSIDTTIAYTDTFKFDATRLNGNNGWQMSNFGVSGNSSRIIVNGTAGFHTLQPLTELQCEKCHMRERDHLSNSPSHGTLTCISCHQMTGSIFHAANIPSCLNCHIYQNSSADTHYQFTFSIKEWTCSTCHSSLNKDITYIRPDSIEWDVVGTNTSWNIENVIVGSNKNVRITKNLDGRLHNVSLDGDCILCHKDINDAVIIGGHSNERWRGMHDYVGYSDMNLYCRSCHMNSTAGNTPISHSGAKTSCLDCHANMTAMKGIDVSMAQQPYYIQSYLCIACKNAGNPDPTNSTLHFRILTEPEVTIYIDGVQRYP